MRGFIVGVLVVVMVGYLGMQFGSVYRAKHDLEERVEHYLDFVDSPDAPAVKRDLALDAAKLGVELTPADIHLVYQDTEELNVPQHFVGTRFAKFKNKQVAISLRYVARIMGFPLSQEITRAKIKQIEVRRAAPNPASPTPLDLGE